MSARGIRFFRLSVVISCAISLGLLLLLIRGALREESRVAEIVSARARTDAKSAATQIEHALVDAQTLLNTLANDLSAAKDSDGQALSARIRQTLLSEPNLVELGIAYAPFAFEPGMRLHAEAYASSEGTIRRIELDSLQDYTESQVLWYSRPMAEGPVWLEPAPAVNGGPLRAIYAVPFYQSVNDARMKRGVVYGVFAAEKLDRTLSSVDIGENGYGFILSSRGAYLSYPNQDYVDGKTTIFETATPADRDRTIAAEKAVRGEVVFASYADALVHKPVWVAYEPIPTPKWTLALVYVQDDARADLGEVRREWMRIGFVTAIFVLLVAAALLRIERGEPSSLWAFAAAFALMCGVMTTYVLTVAARYADQVGSHGMRISGKPEMERYLAEQTSGTLHSHDELPLRIPTGIFVQSVAFVSSSEVRVTGYLWQKYRDGMHDGVARGFILPESESQEAFEAYRQKIGDTELVGWSFRALIHQDFDYSRYPFGRETIVIQISPKDFHRNIMLVPDLDSYKLTTPDARAGLREGLSLPGWDIVASEFSYRTRTYKAKFGFNRYVSMKNLPELQFEVVAQKEVLTAFVIHLMPVFVVLTMLFTIVMMATSDIEKGRMHGFDTMKVISACAGFFLAVIFSHIDLRKTLATREFVYLEYFHFVTYWTLLSMSVNALLFSRAQTGLLRYRDNFLTKLLYWPGILATILIMTVYSFY